MIEQHVTSLELSKKLVEAGIVVESEFVWVTKYPKNEKETFNDVVSRMGRPDSKTENSEIIPAPLSSELGELLPELLHQSCVVVHNDYSLWIGTNYDGTLGGSWVVTYKQTQTGGWLHTEVADTMPDAMAKMLLYLKEKGLL